MTKIEELKKLSPQKRVQCLERLFRKNQKFFSHNYPAVAELLRPGAAAPFHINVTDEFLTIINKESGELCHPEVGLDRFAEKLGDWTHNAWIDLIEGRTQSYTDVGKYSQLAVRLQQEMIKNFPGLTQRMSEKKINMPSLPNGKHFSNPVVFMGIFHGLHIDYYLSHTQINTALMVEPDAARFALSCYFLDFERLAKRFGELLLHIGEGLPDNTLDLFFKKARVSAAVWARVLPGYSFEMEPLIAKLRLRWRQAYDVWHPADWQLTGYQNIAKNIKKGARIYARKAALSARSRIAVIGAGPSLSQDLDWLKVNQDQFVIFAVHSAVSALKNKGIKPDFQFTLDINPWPDEHFERLQLDPSIPLINTVGDVPEKFSDFKDVLMLVESGGIHPVKFQNAVPFLTPTSGNMALAFACWCRPEKVYLFGLDFGFKEAAKTHVAEGTVYQSEEEHKAMLFSGHLPVEANFNGSEIVSQAYFNLARLCAQNPIVNVRDTVKVFNCSDGAKISGTQPCRSVDIEKHDYDKVEDVKTILAMFSSLEEGIHWFAYPQSGPSLLSEFKHNLLDSLKLKKFNWLEFSYAIDHFRESANVKDVGEISVDSDRRLEPYCQVVDLLLNSWYRFLCFTNNADEWQRVYNTGYETFSSLVEEMVWPEEADIDNYFFK